MIQGNFNTEGPFTISITIGSYTFGDNDLKSLSVNESLIEGSLSIGNAGACTASVKLFNKDTEGQDTDVNNINVRDDILITLIDNTGENSCIIARQKVLGIEKEGIITTLSCGDRMMDDLSDTKVTLTGMAMDAQSDLEMAFPQDLVLDVSGVSWGLSSYSIDSDSQEEYLQIISQKRSVRDCIGMYAGLVAGNAVIDRVTGKLKIIQLPSSYSSVYTITPSITYSLKTEVMASKVCDVNINSDYYFTGTPAGNKYNLLMKVDNELFRLLDKDVNIGGAYPYVAGYLENIEYTGFSASCVGNPLVEVGDCVDIVDRNNNTVTSIISSINMTYDGSFRCTYTADTDTTTPYDLRKNLDRSNDMAIARAVREEGTETRKAIEELTGGGGGVSPELMEVYTNMKKFMLKYDSASSMWVFLGATPTSYVAKNIVTKGTTEVLQNVTYAQPVDGGYATAGTQVLMVSGASVYYTAISGSDAYKYITTVPKGGEYAVRIPKILSMVDFEGIFAKEITSTDDMAGWNVGEIGYILTSI